MTKQILSAELKHCCAVEYFYRIGFDLEIKMNSGKKVVEEQLKRKIKKIEHSFFDNIRLIFVILDDYQYENLGSIFRKHGFKVKQKFQGNDSFYLYLMTKLMD